jgi:hypothetical protein
MVGPQTWDPADLHSRSSSCPLSKEQGSHHQKLSVVVVVVVVVGPHGSVKLFIACLTKELGFVILVF